MNNCWWSVNEPLQVVSKDTRGVSLLFRGQRIHAGSPNPGLLEDVLKSLKFPQKTEFLLEKFAFDSSAHEITDLLSELEEHSLVVSYKGDLSTLESLKSRQLPDLLGPEYQKQKFNHLEKFLKLKKVIYTNFDVPNRIFSDFEIIPLEGNENWKSADINFVFLMSSTVDLASKTTFSNLRGLSALVLFDQHGFTLGPLTAETQRLQSTELIENILQIISQSQKAEDLCKSFPEHYWERTNTIINQEIMTFIAKPETSLLAEKITCFDFLNHRKISLPLTPLDNG